MPTMEECTDVYDGTHVSISFSSVAFSSSLTTGRDLSAFWVVDSAYSINITVFLGDFITFEPPSGSSRIGSVGVNVHGIGTVGLTISLVFGQIIHRTIHAMCTPDLSSRSAHRIKRLLIVSWMQSYCGHECLFSTDFDLGLLVVPKGMRVLKLSGNGLYMLSNC
jgi:hypothetical protein